MKAFNLDPGQAAAFLRHVYTALGSIAALLGAMSFMDPATIAAILAALHQIGDGILSVLTGITALIPLITGLYAAWTASHKSKMTAIATDPQTTSPVKKAVNAALNQ